ncbi:DUF4345 domain-containing protein [Pseudomonadota bacterium]
MTKSYMQISVLSISGLIAIGFGGTILIAPEAFYATYGITLGHDPSQLNEIRASGGALLGLGLVIAAGAIWSQLTFASIVASSAVYLSYGLSRLVSLALDGSPNDGLIVAAVLELGIGVVSLFTLCRYLRGARIRTS